MSLVVDIIDKLKTITSSPELKADIDRTVEGLESMYIDLNENIPTPNEENLSLTYYGSLDKVLLFTVNEEFLGFLVNFSTGKNLDVGEYQRLSESIFELRRELIRLIPREKRDILRNNGYVCFICPPLVPYGVYFKSELTIIKDSAIIKRKKLSLVLASNMMVGAGEPLDSLFFRRVFHFEAEWVLHDEARKKAEVNEINQVIAKTKSALDNIQKNQITHSLAL